MVFTGLVSAQGTGGFDPSAEGDCRRLTVRSEGYFKGVLLGDSIAVNGCCLTAVTLSDDTAGFDVMAESRRLTCLEDRETFNLEKAMTAQDRLGGHIVQGHVHGIGSLAAKKTTEDDSINFWFVVPSVPEGCRLKHKGSICIDGVSLTVAEIADGKVRVSIIPHTQKVTSFGLYEEDDRVNIEFDSSGTESTPYTDEDFMRIAIAQGELGRVGAPPNPWVGCCVTKGGKVIGKGYHKKAGTPHAEINAMADVADPKDLEGATVYSTLEPCSHHGRTGPCCEALVAAKIARCVVAVLDPDTKVSGRGNAYLRSHGVEVVEHICTKEAELSLLPYLHQRRTGLPYIVMKIATTLDGYVACSDNTSQWITGPEARSAGQTIRSQSQAILVGSGTVLADNPRLTVRSNNVEQDTQPLRVVLDRRGRVTDGSLHVLSGAKTVVFTEGSELKGSDSVEVVTGAFTLESVLKELASRGVLQVMVEGGGEVHTSFMEARMCNKLIIFQGATFFGQGKKWIDKKLCTTIAAAQFMTLLGVEKVGNDVRLEYSMEPFSM